MALMMPKPEAEILANRDRLIERLIEILPSDSVIDDETARRAYECDALDDVPPVAARRCAARDRSNRSPGSWRLPTK